MEKYLAFDASGETIFVCAYNGRKYVEKRLEASGTEHLMMLIDKVLKSLKMDITEVEVVALSVGPGSWTGSRVTVVTGYGLTSANPSLKVCMFNSFDLLSYNDSDKKDKLYLVKAYANFVYAKGEKLSPACMLKSEVTEKFGGYKKVAASPVMDDVEIKEPMYREVIEKKIAACEFVDIKDVEPMYLRLSQAEIQRQEKIKKEAK